MKFMTSVCGVLLLGLLASAGSSQVLWTVFPDPVPFEQSVELKIENRLRCTIYLPSSAPWSIYDSNGKLVYSPPQAPVIVPIKPLGFKTFTWNQLFMVTPGAVPGTYEARINYLDCQNKKVTLRTKFEILPVYLKVSGKPVPGSRMHYHFHAPKSTGKLYQAACSLGDLPGIPLAGNRLLRLNPDRVFLLSLLFPGTTFENFTGVTSKSGNADFFVNIPRNKGLIGVEYYTAALTFLLGAPGNIHMYSTSKGVTVVR